MRAAGASYRGALHNRDFRLLAGALSQSAMGDWAYNVALIVYVYDKTQAAAWVSACLLGRMIPRFLALPYGGVLAERSERIRLMVTSDLSRAVVMAGMTAAVASDAPAWLAIAMAGVLSVAQCVYDPSTAAMVPQILGEDDLAAGNALLQSINNVAIIAGPAVGAVILALGNPSIVMGVDACTFLASALLISRVTARSTPSDVAKEGGPLQQIAVGVKAIVDSPTARLLSSFAVVTTMLYGADTVLFVFVSKDKLSTGSHGYGYLLVALGVGGIIAATFVNRLAALPRLSVVLSAGMVVYALPTALLVGIHAPAAAFVIEVVRGVATVVVDVLAMTALQRSLAPHLIARVFGVFWALIIAGCSVGGLVMPLLLKTAGLNGALLLDALVVPAVVVIVYPRLSRLDRLSAVQAVQLAPFVGILSQLDLFAAAPQLTLERLATGATPMVLEPGASVVREGERADALYVLVDGRVEVSARGENGAAPKHIRYMTAPCYIGEIGLLEAVPRTATVIAVQPSRLLRIDGDEFLSALTETTLSSSFMSGMSMRLARTHPSREITVAAQRAGTTEVEAATATS